MAKKKNNNMTLWIVLGIVALILFSTIGMYNSLVNTDTAVEKEWANVETQYQRRADLIPNLVETVQGAVAFEQETQTQIAAVRTSAVAAQQSMKAATTPAELNAAAKQVDNAVSGFSGLNINVENYPELKATANFLSLQDELAGSENRVATARTRFNEAVMNYNRKTRTFPSVIIANMFGFDQKESFEAETGAEVAPDVEF